MCPGTDEVAVGHVVVVGAGHAGVQCAASLREGGFSGTVALVSEEGHLPYQRPSLSKDHLHETAEPLPLRGLTFYDDNDVALVRGVAVRRLDRDRREVVLADGRSLLNTALVLATGAGARCLPAVDPASWAGARRRRPGTGRAGDGAGGRAPAARARRLPRGVGPPAGRARGLGRARRARGGSGRPPPRRTDGRGRGGGERRAPPRRPGGGVGGRDPARRARPPGRSRRRRRRPRRRAPAHLGPRRPGRR